MAFPFEVDTSDRDKADKHDENADMRIQQPSFTESRPLTVIVSYTSFGHKKRK